MRRVRYSVAMSLDGFIAGPSGETDWIVMDPDIDFGALFGGFDTMLLGGKTHDATPQQGGGGGMPSMKAYVFSRTLRQSDCPDVAVSANPHQAVAALKAGVWKGDSAVWRWVAVPQPPRAEASGYRGGRCHPRASRQRAAAAALSATAGDTSPDQPPSVREDRYRDACVRSDVRALRFPGFAFVIVQEVAGNRCAGC